MVLNPHLNSLTFLTGVGATEVSSTEVIPPPLDEQGFILDDVLFLDSSVLFVDVEFAPPQTHPELLLLSMLPFD